MTYTVSTHINKMIKLLKFNYYFCYYIISYNYILSVKV